MIEDNISQSAETTDALTRSPESAPRRILVMTSLVDVLQLSAEVLTRCGYEVRATTSSEVAWEALQTDDYDLVIADGDMPDMSGVRLLKRLRYTRMATPVIITTSTSPWKTIPADRHINPDAILPMPYTVSEFLGKVQEVLGVDPGSEQPAVASSQPTQIEQSHHNADNSPEHPIALPPASEPVAAPQARKKNPTHRILVVEDDQEIRSLNTQLLTDFGYHVDAATDGAVAWDALQSKTYHLIVTDNEMPKVTGVDLLKKLHAARMALPVIMATGAVPSDAFNACPWLVPAALLIKPYTPQELLGAVKQVLYATNPATEPPVPPLFS